MKKQEYYKHLPIYNFKKYSLYEICKIPIKNGMEIRGAGKAALCVTASIIVYGTAKQMLKTIMDWESMMEKGKTVLKRRSVGVMGCPKIENKEDYILTEEDLKKVFEKFN